MAGALETTRVKNFDASGSVNDDSFLWPGGEGVFGVQGDQDGATASVQICLNHRGVAEASWNFGALQDSSGNPVSLSGLTSNSAVKGMRFWAPRCQMRMVQSGGTSPDYHAMVTNVSQTPRFK